MVPQSIIDQITKTKGVLASVKTYLDGEAERHQKAIDAAIANGATAEQLAPVQALADDMGAQSDDIAAAIAANS